MSVSSGIKNHMNSKRLPLMYHKMEPLLILLATPVFCIIRIESLVMLTDCFLGG